MINDVDTVKIELENKLKDTLSQHFKVDSNLITMDSSFQELGADSLDFFQIIIDTEQILGITIPDDRETLVNIKTFGDFLNFVHKVVESQAENA